MAVFRGEMRGVCGRCYNRLAIFHLAHLACSSTIHGMAGQKTLLKWTEPWAFAKDRAARSRSGWKIWQRLTFGFLLGTMIFVTALLNSFAKGSTGTTMPERNVSDWVGLWVTCCFVLTGMFWLLCLIPLPRTVWIRQ